MPKPHAPVRVAVFGTKPYDRHFLDAAGAGFDHRLTYFEPRLDEATTALAAGYGAVCVFVNDTLNEAVLTVLHKSGTRIVALRCAGYNNVDLRAAGRLGMTAAVDAMAAQGIRVLGVAAAQTTDKRWAKSQRDYKFKLIGLVGLADPIRESVPAAVAECRSAGIPVAVRHGAAA